MKIIRANILTAFNPETIGTKIVDRATFMYVLEEAITQHDISTDRIPGQHFIKLPKGKTFVLGGVGKRTDRPEDYVARLHRGKVGLFLKREYAAPVDDLACVVYTAQAYLDDPEVRNDPEECGRVKAFEATHVLVAVLASAGPTSTLSPERFVANLAGGNKEAQVWGADEIRERAKLVADYNDKWCVVAD